MVLDYLVASFIDSSYCGPQGYDGLLGVSGALVGGITEHIEVSLYNAVFVHLLKYVGRSFSMIRIIISMLLNSHSVICSHIYTKM